MKFLLELVSCCGCHESCGGGASPVPERPSETSSLVPVVRQAYRRGRRGRLGGVDGGGGRLHDWKPSLCAISEDNVVLERERDKTETERVVVKRKSQDGFHVRSYSKDYGKSSIPTFIPAFSPTPFMF